MMERVSVSSEYGVCSDGGTVPPKTPIEVMASSRARRQISPR